MKRIFAAGVCLTVVVGACGGSMSETEYVEGLNNLVVTAGTDLQASFETYEQIADPTLADFVARVEREIAVEYAVRDRFEALDPPDSIADVHQVMVDTLARILTAAEELVEVADTVGTLEEAEQTPEFATYQAINAESDRMCPEVQRKLDDLAAGGEGFGAGPWVVDLRLTVRAFLDCE